MSDRELLFLEQAARGRIVVEFGSWVGRSTKALATDSPLVVACDWWRGDQHPNGIHARMLAGGLDVEAEFRRNLAGEIEEGRVRPLTVDLSSPEAPQTIRDALGHATPQLVFIDANHTAPHPSRDICTAAALVGTQGIICGHDFDERGWPDVPAAVRRHFRAVRFGPDSIWWAKGADFVA